MQSRSRQSGSRQLLPCYVDLKNSPNLVFGLALFPRVFRNPADRLSLVSIPHPAFFTFSAYFPKEEKVRYAVTSP